MTTSHPGPGEFEDILQGRTVQEHVDEFWGWQADQTEAFLHELAGLSHKYGIAIAGTPTLFMLERDDTALAYGCDAESKLTLV